MSILKSAKQLFGDIFGGSLEDAIKSEIDKTSEKNNPQDELVVTTADLTFQYLNRFAPENPADRLILTYESQDHPFPPKLYWQTGDTVTALEFNRLKNKDYYKLDSLSGDLNLKFHGNIKKIEHIYHTLLTELNYIEFKELYPTSPDFKIILDKDYSLINK